MSLHPFKLSCPLLYLPDQPFYLKCLVWMILLFFKIADTASTSLDIEVH